MAESTRVLEVADLVAGYGGPPIVEAVTCAALRAQITAVLGPNGAGKSTLLKAIIGALPVTAGSVVLGDRNVTGYEPEALVRLGLSYVPQVSGVFPTLSVRENLEIGGYTCRSAAPKRIDFLCNVFPDLARNLKRPAGTLSGGQRNMLAMARGLMTDPKLMLLDEPTAGLAPLMVTTVWDQILRIRDIGVAILIVEQNTRRTLRHADWAYVMSQGRIKLEGTGQELLADRQVVDLYIGG